MDIQTTLAERGDRYGDFSGHAKIAQDLQDVMRNAVAMPMKGGTVTAWNKLSFVEKQSLSVIADKIARILNGDPGYDDNWRDIVGYATLALEQCRDSQEKVTSQEVRDGALYADGVEICGANRKDKP